MIALAISSSITAWSQAATLIAASTVYTKQHYVVDAVAGAILGYAAYGIFVRGYPRDAASARIASPRRADPCWPWRSMPLRSPASGRRG